MNDPMLLGYADATDPELQVLWPDAMAYVTAGIEHAIEAIREGRTPDPVHFDKWQRETNAWLDALIEGRDPAPYENTLGIVAVYAKEETHANDDQ